MATTTENLGMTLPDTTDPVDVTVLNGNFSALDTFAGTQTEKDTEQDDRLTALETSDTAQDTTIAKLVDAGAKNLLKNTAPYGDLVKTNITFTHNDDDTYTVNATSANTANTDLYVATDVPIKAGTYVLSGCPEGGNNTDTFKIQIAGIGYDLGDGLTFTIAQDTTINVYIRIWNGYVPNGLIFRPMICTAEDHAASDAFVPYTPTLRELYEMIQALQTGGTT